jgi:hypothetical protein
MSDASPKMGGIKSLTCSSLRKVINQFQVIGESIDMRFKLQAKHLKQAYKFASKNAPIALIVAEVAFPNAKTIRTVSKVVNTLF